jgi:hypothetical protein
MRAPERYLGAPADASCTPGAATFGPLGFQMGSLRERNACKIKLAVY